MDWHRRYLQQANWTRDLREYIFKKTDVEHADRVLEIGCGTGAILSDLPKHISLHGLDFDATALAQCTVHAPAASLVQGNALQLPYANEVFDIVYCHFLLLWVKDPIQSLLEMKRVAKTNAYVISFAEPDYTARVDEPPELVLLVQWQTESLKRKGADPSLGVRLADLFFQAGIKIIETGTIQSASREPSYERWETEWAVTESDLAGFIPSGEIHKMKMSDQQAWRRGERVLYVPTYFAWGQA